MEILAVVFVLAMIGLAALGAGADSRPGIDDEPRRSL